MKLGNWEIGLVPVGSTSFCQEIYTTYCRYVCSRLATGPAPSNVLTHVVMMGFERGLPSAVAGAGHVAVP